MKITCNIIEDLLPLYVDDMVSEDSRQLVEEHLKTCPACRKMQEAGWYRGICPSGGHSRSGSRRNRTLLVL